MTYRKGERERERILGGLGGQRCSKVMGLRPKGSRRKGGREQGEGGALGRVGEGKGGDKRREEVPR